MNDIPIDPEIITEVLNGITEKKDGQDALVLAKDPIPTVLPAISVPHPIPFPNIIFSALITKEEFVNTLQFAKANAGFVVLHPEDPVPNHDGVLRNIGVACEVIKDFVLPDGERSVLLKVLKRCLISEYMRQEPFQIVRIEIPEEFVTDPRLSAALEEQLRAYMMRFVKNHPQLPDEMKIAIYNTGSPGELTDLIAQHFINDLVPRLEMLSTLDLDSRLSKSLEVMIKEVDLLSLGNKISEEIQQKIEKHQREFYLREQLKAIRKELGEEKDDREAQLDELTERLTEAKLPEDAQNKADEELSRLKTIPMESPEYQMVRTYLDWLAVLPWSITTDEQLNLEQAQKILDQDHHGLEKVKERIVEFLAVRQLRKDPGGTILCLAGPPGVGKTSLGKSIARAMGRTFYRFALGGMRDEAEIKGHRRTYIGAMPGKILQGLKQVGYKNPVFMLDEIDKVGKDWRGDPSSALLEVLDPAQNGNFLDHYLDVSFDLSQVMFIATANVKSEIPAPLLDRMEVIDLAGYLPEEKIDIALKYLLPRQREEHGLKARQLKFGRRVASKIINDYTREAGVRELERQIAKLCRKAAMSVVSNTEMKPSISIGQLADYLGPEKNVAEKIPKRPKIGVSIGLAWTAAGGDTLKIEVIRMPGTGKVITTGHLGDVMKESTSIALSYIRTVASKYELNTDDLNNTDIHIHFPAGAVPKDGPSAGITIATALFSSFSNTQMKIRVAMTGELSLTGDVLPVGGIREKCLAAHRAGMKTVLLPEQNEKDAQELPDDIKDKLSFHFMSDMSDVLDYCFE
jgi:ATP-dependent Lon protease